MGFLFKTLKVIGLIIGKVSEIHATGVVDEVAQHLHDTLEQAHKIVSKVHKDVVPSADSDMEDSD